MVRLVMSGTGFPVFAAAALQTTARERAGAALGRKLIADDIVWTVFARSRACREWSVASVRRTTALYTEVHVSFVARKNRLGRGRM
jgi:hypothetical protein